MLKSSVIYDRPGSAGLPGSRIWGEVLPSPLSHQSEGNIVFSSAKDGQTIILRRILFLSSGWTKEGGEGGGLGDSFKIRYGLQPGVVAHAHNPD